jgi:hypothetical protein
VNHDVDPEDPAYSNWRKALRGFCEAMVDLSVVDMRQQPANVQNVRLAMDKHWDYIGGHLRDINFVGRLVSIAKNKRRALYSTWRAGNCDPNMPAPVTIESSKWTKLLKYWQSHEFHAS